MPKSRTRQNSPPLYVKQCGNFAIPADTLEQACEILGVAITPSINSSSATAVIEPPTADIENVKLELRSLGLTAKTAGQRRRAPGTLEIVPLWQDYVTRLPRYRAGEKGAWKLARKRLAPDVLAMNYNPLANSFTFELPRQRSIYMLTKRSRQENEIWMSTADLELSTMSEQIEAAHGHVLVGGLGMGVYAHLVCRKPEVVSVTVIEPEPEVIDIIKPVIDNPKLRVVQSAFEEYCSTADARRPFDYCFVDIWLYAAESYVHEADKRAMALPLMSEAGSVEVWCQAINDRKRASIAEVKAAQASTLELKITEVPCYLCCSDFRLDVAGLCLGCASKTWEDTPSLSGKPFPYAEKFREMRDELDTVSRILNLSVATPFE